MKCAAEKCRWSPGSRAPGGAVPLDLRGAGGGRAGEVGSRWGTGLRGSDLKQCVCSGSHAVGGWGGRSGRYGGGEKPCGACGFAGCHLHGKGARSWHRTVRVRVLTHPVTLLRPLILSFLISAMRMILFTVRVSYEDQMKAFYLIKGLEQSPGI